MHGTYPMTEKSIILGRQTENEWCINRGKTSERTTYCNVTSSKKVSKEAIKIEFNEKKEEFFLTNLNKNTILVDRAPVKKGQEVKILHHTPIQISSEVMLFFQLPHETIEKKKKWLKDKRRDRHE